MIIPYITKKQQEILRLIYIFRFLTRIQIQKFLKHKDKKTINLWLRDLVEKQYLKRRKREDNFEQRTKPAIYFSDLNAIRFFKNQEYIESTIIKKLYQEHTRKQDFIDRCILLADACLDLIKSNSKDKSYTYITTSEYANGDNLYHFLTELKDHAPDLVYIEEKGAKRKTKTYYLLSIIDSTLPRYRVRRRIRNYIEFYFQNSWGENISKQFPIIRFISPTKVEMIRTKRFTKKVLEENRTDNLTIQLTYAKNLKEFGIAPDLWEEV